MSITQTLKQSSALVGFMRDARKVMDALKHNNAIGRSGPLIAQYLESHPIRKLQVGAGFTLLDGWLSTDIHPQYNGSAFLDATKPFPFEDGSLDYIYSEHMIEHVPWKDGLFMLRECRRVLKPGGAIRVATPDLRVLLDLYTNKEDPRIQQYIHWVTDRFLVGVRVYKSQFVINNAFRNWGHQFLYDAEVLTMALQEAGFEDIREMPSGQSEDPHLQGLECHNKGIQADEMTNFETIVFEARRPKTEVA
jgi:predicted SAM-dependent methyltransferase